MELTFYQVDAFAHQPFTGNPAAICLLDEWPEDGLMQDIAMENNLAETAFLVKEEGKGEGHYHLRWFTPAVEVDLCGHATLASAHALWRHYGEGAATLTFATRSGALIVSKGPDGLIEMDFPSNPVSKALPDDFSNAMIGKEATESFISGTYPFLVLSDEAAVLGLNYADIDFKVAENAGLHAALIVTAPANGGSGADCVSRFFAPYAGIPEDPVTGSIHTSIVPYWAKKLGKKDIIAYQASPRGGMLTCRNAGDRVVLRGTCSDYMRAVITL